MKYITTMLLAGTTAMFMSACGGGSSSSTPPVDYSGNYEMVVTSNPGTDVNGNQCRGANGSITVTNNMVSGSVVSDWGNTFTLDGEVTSNGQISGKFSIGDDTIGQYEGQVGATGATGTWADVGGCAGNWVAEKQ